MTAAAFDIYGTLADTSAIAATLNARGIAGAESFAARWREKQLEYAFRRALMQRRASFAECTKSALNFVAAERGISLSDDDRDCIMNKYAALPVFADAEPALSALSGADVQIFAFSNGEKTDVQALLARGGLARYFADVVSAEEANSFKPDPKVYARFLRRAGAEPENAWLVSANAFDIVGARAAGWNAVWINRGATIFDPWPEPEFQPTAVASSLTELPQILPAQ